MVAKGDDDKVGGESLNLADVVKAVLFGTVFAVFLLSTADHLAQHHASTTTVQMEPLPPIETVARAVSAVADGDDAARTPGTYDAVEQTYTLINSFWANTPGSECIGMNNNKYPPRQPCAIRHNEVRGAMRANLLNSALAELVVLYEARPDDGCDEMKAALLRTIPTGRYHAKLTCVSQDTQPTYAELFEFANTQPAGPFVGNVVIVGNADAVFDKSLSQMPPVGGKYAYALTINKKVNRTQYLDAMSDDEVCPSIKTSNEFRGEGVDQTGAWFRGTKVRDDRCPWKGQGNSKGPAATSFDAFVFRPPLPPGWQQRAAALSPLDLPMNRLGMENRAKCGLEAAGLTVLNACFWVRLMHYHKCAWYSHDDSAFVEAPDPKCDRATYPCMLYSNGPTSPMGSWKGSPVVSTDVCKQPDSKINYSPSIKAVTPQDPSP